jgi:hypothetical protein
MLVWKAEESAAVYARASECSKQLGAPLDARRGSSPTVREGSIVGLLVVLCGEPSLTVGLLPRATKSLAVELAAMIGTQGQTSNLRRGSSPTVREGSTTRL